MADPRPEPFRDDPETTAAEWLARRDAGLTPAEETEFAHWLRADERHRTAWRELEAAWRIFDQPRHDGVAGAMVAELSTRRRRRRFFATLGVASGLAAAVLVMTFVWPPTILPAPVVTAASGVVSRPELRTLPDGSVVELNKGTEIAVEFTPERRGIRLVRGEAHFAVTKNPARPFVVMVGSVEVRAVGTAFSVKRDPQTVDVLVTEGQVAVEGPPATTTAQTPRPPVLIAKGDYLSVSTQAKLTVAAQPRAVAPDEMERLLSWREARLELSGTPLREAVALLNRESKIHLRLEDEELAAMRISGTFRADNAEGFARILETHYGATAERRGENEVVLKKAR